ncbi:MAG: hypothetical protein HOK21_24850 [Rhodospirillaceae bacterium]|jgi:hypothetical protein|nr:hypothetical protein [Rhodospirillaceae bacterium]MBT5527329.1 hypothetical protein [Rhodospirillaceae bacterium]MBT5878337.1 hypothetical protein [Rhodospirillaceae bacterium]MBT7286907.1 hypothetical protein [Rhodospirillaceae bacterium]MBT7979437.1 hypothetical protein [Rhodospirillaceae bacterium]
MTQYRLIFHDTAPQPFYGLHEVTIDDDGKAITWRQEPADFTCRTDEGPEDVIQALANAAHDAETYPILQASELPGN